MERREFIALLGMASAMLPAASHVGPGACARLAASLQARGASPRSINIRKDGSTFDRWGVSPKGIFIFDRGGQYAQIIIGSESRVFGAKTFCSFGSYSLDDAKNILVTRVEGCSVPSLTGTEQMRTILALTKEELKYSNPITASGATAEVLWKRIG